MPIEHSDSIEKGLIFFRNNTGESKALKIHGNGLAALKKWKGKSRVDVDGFNYFATDDAPHDILMKIKHSPSLSYESKLMLFASLSVNADEYNGRRELPKYKERIMLHYKDSVVLVFKRWLDHFQGVSNVPFDARIKTARDQGKSYWCWFYRVPGFSKFYKLFERLTIFVSQASPGNRKNLNINTGDSFVPALERGTYDHENFASIFMVMIKPAMDAPDYYCRESPLKRSKKNTTSPHKIVSMN